MSRVAFWLGLGFLWAPVLLMAGFAFSDARQPFVWGGFSWRWFVALAGNERGHKGREKRKKGKGKGRLSASPAYAGEVGGIGDDSGVLFRASRAVI